MLFGYSADYLVKRRLPVRPVSLQNVVWGTPQAKRALDLKKLVDGLNFPEASSEVILILTVHR